MTTSPLSRRYFLGECGIGLGKIAAASLLTNNLTARSHEPKTPQIKPRAKAVIHLFMAGAPSQLELFDPKPHLTKLEGSPLPKSIIGDQRYAFIQPDAAVLGPQFEFSQYGETRATLGSPLAPLGAVADDLCIVKSCTTDQFNHAPAQLFLNSGFSQPGRPSLGSWTLYGLGSESNNLPAFVVMSTGGGLSGGSALWSSGFLPTTYTGVQFRKGKDPILNVGTPDGFSPEVQSDTFDLVNKLNAQRLATINDEEIATRMASYEMAARLQSSAPELMELKTESDETINLYGCDRDKHSFARACLLARRMVQRGVRFINIYHSGWDAHSNVKGSTEGKCAQTAQATAALIQDLKRHGLLDDTLVVWGGEFGRTPMVKAHGRKDGRDHNPRGFTTWLAGGGTKPGYAHGATDEVGDTAVTDRLHMHDLHATLLHLLGLDHERLTYNYAGRNFRLTDVAGNVEKAIIA